VTAISAHIERWERWWTAPAGIAPLVTLRVVIGAMLAFSTARFMALGWVDDHYIRPVFHFAYAGFEWVRPLPPAGLYAVHILLLLSSLAVLLGYRYRLAAVLQFLLFTYTELLDLTYYLNHYYFVSIASALLIVVPAHRAFSLDVWRRPEWALEQVPRWTIAIFQLQLGIVYCYAGIWKIHADWLIHALPLRIWLPANDQLPLIGPFLAMKYTPWLFSWAGMLYDATIVGWLLWARTRPVAYLTVILFHAITGLLFQIGVFPLVMMGATLVFFSEKWHARWQDWFRRRVSPNTRHGSARSEIFLFKNFKGYTFFQKTALLYQTEKKTSERSNVGTDHQSTCDLPTFDLSEVVNRIHSLCSTNMRPLRGHFERVTQDFSVTDKNVYLLKLKKTNLPRLCGEKFVRRFVLIALFFHFSFQILFPWRFLLYPGDVFWTEQGYRFAWRVMLMEKAGTATFYVKDGRTGREGEVVNREFLNAHQEKQMAMQPDMILQFARFLEKHYADQGVHEPVVRAEVYVTLNARPSRLLFDPALDLTQVRSTRELFEP
jgi:hypothetical protein